jgi:hypothetical protein
MNVCLFVCVSVCVSVCMFVCVRVVSDVGWEHSGAEVLGEH